MGLDSGLLPGDIHNGLVTELFGRRIYYIGEVDSTNRLAKDLARDGEPEGTLVITEFQTAGRGRRERVWSSPPRANLLFSLILRPGKTALATLPMTMCFSLRIAELMTNRLGCDVGVKWPNDVVTKGGKLCGILSESTTRGRRVDVVIVGIGINVNMERSQFPPGVPAVSCLSVTGRRHDRRDLLTDVLGVLEDGYAGFLGSGFSPLIDRYVARLVLMGKTVVFQRGGEKVVAEVTGVEPDGALAVRSRDGRTVKLYDEEIRSQQEPS